MENVPRINERLLVPLEWPASPYLADHRFLGKAVLPAVESMELLAGAVKSAWPATEVTSISDIDMKRFLPLDGDPRRIAAELRPLEDGAVSAMLVSELKSRSGSVTRKFEHFSAVFGRRLPAAAPVATDVAAGLLGPAERIDRAALYGDMVPFGPAFHNAESVFVTAEGAAAFISSGRGTGRDDLLGSPFTLDAAFHCACAWGQYALGFVGFPVAMERRDLLVPTKPGTEYYARIQPVSAGAGSFTADILIFAMEGELHERGAGLVMKDIRAGKLAPPARVKRGADPLEGLARGCDALAVIELDAVPPFARLAMTRRERERSGTMGEKRKRSYTGARLACKRLYRVLPGNDPAADPAAVETQVPGSEKPSLPGPEPVHVTVSHDARFAAAAASRRPIGIDVEREHERLVKVKRFYVTERERPLIDAFAGGEVRALLRIWTIKEAAAKAFGMTLAETWKRTEVTAIGEGESALAVDGVNCAALHGSVDGHLFTLVFPFE